MDTNNPREREEDYMKDNYEKFKKRKLEKFEFIKREMLNTRLNNLWRNYFIATMLIN
jgi:hypothetical protein